MGGIFRNSTKSEKEKRSSPFVRVMALSGTEKYPAKSPKGEGETETTEKKKGKAMKTTSAVQVPNTR